jgi:YesN/AraC family two-component response regulator
VARIKEFSIIVAEDEKLIRENIVKKIRSIGEHFVIAGEAHNGNAALQLVENVHPDILITDIKMPVLDGLALTAEVRKLYPLTRIIIVTGYDEFTYAKQAIELGVKNYLLKPVSIGELKKTLVSIQMDIEQEDQERYRELSIFPDINSQRDMVGAVQEYLRRNYGSDVSMQEIAKRFHISREYLSRSFTKHAGIGPSKFLRNIRIAASQKLLSDNPNMEIKEIARAVGYEDQGYYSRVFKMVVGKSPLEYRQSG